VSVSQRKAAVRYLQSHYQASERRACRLVNLSRATVYYRSKRPSQDALRKRILELAMARVRYGYKRIYILLKREGIHVNKKRVHRLYCLEGLQIRPRRPRRSVSAARRQPPKVAARSPNEAWSMDFVTDQTSQGLRFRMLTVIDVFTRECLAIEVGQRLTGEDVARVLSRIARQRGTPKRIYCDNGSEFCSRSMDLWAYSNKVTLEFSRPGKPTDNAFIESFNGSLRDECLNTHWFTDLADAKVKLKSWMKDYNESRPHRALNDLSPLEFESKWLKETSKVA